ncbi:MAG: hypothetical protein AABY22_33645 [Nanoarchaeota archaeon]
MPVNQIKQAKINGETIYVEWEELGPNISYLDGKKKRSKVYAEIDEPNTKKRTLSINPNQNSKNLLISLAHEFFHIYDWSLSEQKVEKFSKELANLLWRVGFTIK